MVVDATVTATIDTMEWYQRKEPIKYDDPLCVCVCVCVCV